MSLPHSVRVQSIKISPATEKKSSSFPEHYIQMSHWVICWVVQIHIWNCAKHDSYDQHLIQWIFPSWLRCIPVSFSESVLTSWLVLSYLRFAGLLSSRSMMLTLWIFWPWPWTSLDVFSESVFVNLFRFKKTFLFMTKSRSCISYSVNQYFSQWLLLARSELTCWENLWSWVWFTPLSGQ